MGLKNIQKFIGLILKKVFEKNNLKHIEINYNVFFFYLTKHPKKNHKYIRI